MGGSRQTKSKGALKKAPFFVGLIGDFFKGISHALFPPSCPTCNRLVSGQNDWPFCAECLTLVEQLGTRVCLRCGRVSYGHTTCSECVDGRTPDPEFPIRSAARYSGPVREAILMAKSSERWDVADYLGLPLVELAKPFLHDDQRRFVVPVPLHTSRLLSRGFNLPDRMALKLGRKVGAGYRPLWLKRSVNTASQVGKNFEERIANMDGAFVLSKPLDLAGCQIFLIDDVATSGATLASAARPLLAAGAEVIGLTLARA